MHDKQVINPSSLAAPRGFNHGILVTGGRMLFLAGQDASGPDGRITAPGDLLAQYGQVLRNLQAVVQEAGGTMQDIVKLTIYVRSRVDYLANLRELGAVHRSYFDSYYPAMALFEVGGFFQEDALIEIEGVAALDSHDARP